MAGDLGHSDSRASMVDLTKFVRKARTICLPTSSPSPILSVSSSDQNNDRSPQVLISSEESVQPDHPDSEKVAESTDDDSGNLKRKLEQSENIESTYNDIHQETDSAMDSPMNIKNSDEISSCTTDDIKDQVVSSPGPVVNDASQRRYDCSLCSKSFTSHRALGGHKSSHNKFKMTICDVIDVVRPKKQLLITNTCDLQQIASSTGRSNIIAVGDERTHTCKICFDKFPSGQALGGHQRCHWTGNSTPADPKKTPKILDFDLNQLPKEEDHEDPSAN